MAEPARQPEGRKVHPVGWEADEWKRILDAADVLSQREHLDLGATDIIRSGTRRFVDELLGPENPAENRRSSDAEAATK